MILAHDGKTPRIDASARIAPTAVICGDVEIGAATSIGFGCVLSAESGPIRIGRECIIMDTAVLRGVRGRPLSLGDHVLVGPRAHLTGCTIEDDVFLATGATIFNGAHIEQGAEVRINGVVHIRSRLPAHGTVPIGWIAVGDPAEIFPAENHDRIWEVQKTLDFPREVFGMERPPEGQSIMPRAMQRYSRRLQSHNDDQLVHPAQSQSQEKQ